MPDEESRRTGDSWAWIHGICPEEVGCLIFVRGATPEQMIAAFGLDPGTARLLPRDDLEGAFRYPVLSSDGQIVCPIIAAGRDGDWAFAIDQVLMANDLSLDLPAGTEGVMIQWTQTIDMVHYWPGNGNGASFEPGMDDAELFLAQAGLDVDLADQVDIEDAEYPYLAALEMLSRATGLQLSEEVGTGPLLYCQRPPESS